MPKPTQRGPVTANQLLRRKTGKHDHVFFCMTKPDDSQSSSVTQALRGLGGVESFSGTPVTCSGAPVLPVAPVVSDKGPVFLTDDLVKLIHEPVEGEASVHIDMDREKILLPQSDWPTENPRWNGTWFGTESSRLLYLKQNKVYGRFASRARSSGELLRFLYTKRMACFEKS